MLNSLLIYRENTEILDHPISERTCIKTIKKYTRILIIQSSDNPILKKKKKNNAHELPFKPMSHAISWQVVKFRWDWFQPLYLTIIFKKFKGSGLVNILIYFFFFFGFRYESTFFFKIICKNN